MKKLGKEITGKFFELEDGFERINRLASGIGCAKVSLSPGQFLILNAARGRDWTKSFCLPTNANKVCSGGMGAWKLKEALTEIDTMVYFTQNGINRAAVKKFLKPFKGLLTERGLVSVWAYLPLPNQDKIPEPFVDMAG